MRTIKWFGFNGLFAVLMYFGLFHQVEGAARLAMFWAWALLLFSFAFLTEGGKQTVRKLKEKHNGKVRTVPAWLDIGYDIAVICAFIWFGYIFTGIAFAIHSFFQNVTVAMIDEEPATTEKS